MTPEKFNAGAAGAFCWLGAAAGVAVGSVGGWLPPDPDVELCAPSGPAMSNAMNAKDLRRTMYMNERDRWSDSGRRGRRGRAMLERGLYQHPRAWSRLQRGDCCDRVTAPQV